MLFAKPALFSTHAVQYVLLALPLLAALPICAQKAKPQASKRTPMLKPKPALKPATFRNPLKIDGADPWMGWHDGWYYLATTTAVDVRLRRARRIGELKDAPDQTVWKDDTPTRFRDIWASEFFRLSTPQGPRWFLYYTASDGKDDANHRLYVAQSRGDDPMGPYDFKAQLQTDPDNVQYAIDGTILTLPDGRMYFLWCGRPSPAGQGIYISRMSNPWTLEGARTYIPAEGFGCPVVREGPAMLQRAGQVFLIYSACPADTPDYKLGLLSADAKADLLDVRVWKQKAETVFARVDQHGVYGPGHNTFFRSPDGREDWIVYHAKSGTANTYGDRSARAQKITWRADNTPDFGLPLPVEADIAVPSGELAPTTPANSAPVSR